MGSMGSKGASGANSSSLSTTVESGTGMLVETPVAATSTPTEKNASSPTEMVVSTVAGSRRDLDSKGPKAMNSFPGTHQTKNTKGTGLRTVQSIGVQVQEKHAGDVQEAEKGVEDCGKTEEAEDGTKELEDVKEDMENVEEFEDVESYIRDANDVGKEIEKDDEMVDNNQEGAENGERVESGKGGTEEVEDVEYEVEEDVEEDIGDGVEEYVRKHVEKGEKAPFKEEIGEDVKEKFGEEVGAKVKESFEGDAERHVEDIHENMRGDSREPAKEDVEGTEQRHKEKEGSRARSEERKGQGKSLEVHIDDSEHTRTTNHNDLADKTEDAEERKENATVNRGSESPMEARQQTEPLQSLLTGSKMATKALSTPEDIKTFFSQLAAFTLHRPRRTALGTRNFTTYVLNPRGIHIDTHESKTESAFEHFKSVEPPPGSNVARHYTQLSGLRSSTLWVNPTVDAIQSIHSNYSEMHQSVPSALCEPEWVDDAVKFLLKSEPRRKLQPKPSSPSQWLPIRMREESFRPHDGGVWDIPPIIHADVPVDPTFSFNVQPDCSYWIWTGGFRPEINGKLTSLASVRFRRSLCPYLTIEVKKDTRNSSKGRQQIAVAASTALYNRWRLRESYLWKTGRPFGRDLFSDVRHYGLLLAGVRFEIWCLRPHNNTSNYSTNSWTGCDMKRVYSGDLDTSTGIKDCINWINEIHCWGNTRHSSGCARDIESRLLPEGKMLTSTMAQLALVKKEYLQV